MTEMSDEAKALMARMIANPIVHVKCETCGQTPCASLGMTFDGACSGPPIMFTQLDLDHAVASERAAVVAWLSREAQAESRHGRGLSEPAWRQFEERAMHLQWLSKQIGNGAHNGQAATGGGV